MAAKTATRLIHPAQARLREQALAERRLLARALAIESDWRYHDGPEWASRYWAAFGDLSPNAMAPGAHATRSLAGRAHWPVLDAGQAEQARRIYRALLATLDPRVVPCAGQGAHAILWARIQMAYRGGDARSLCDLLRQARALDVHTPLPVDIVALRAERDRLRGAREAADLRLAELSQTFPFCMRDKLDDADWIRRQRLALRQIRVLAAPPRGARGAASADHQQVS